MRHRCVLFPWVFNIFLERVVRQVNERATMRGMKLRDGNGGFGNVNKHYMYMTQFRYQKQEIVSSTLAMILRGRVTVWGNCCAKRGKKNRRENRKGTKRKKQGAGAQPGYPGTFGRRLRPA